jgi:branched-chain amino acid transport system substrate-binding protein
MKRIGGLALLLLIAISGAALPVPAATQQPIRIGASMSLTGKYSLQGGYGREVYMLCQKHVNANGGVLGRPIEFVVDDDRSDEKTAISIYEKLITQDKVDAVLGPYSSPITDAVADVNERHRMLMIAPMGATTSIWEKGRRYLIMLLAPNESISEGVIDLAFSHGLKKLAVLNQDGLVARAAAKGTGELAREKGLQLVFSETYPNGTADFSGTLNKVKEARPDVLVVASVSVEDLAAITRQTKQLGIDVKMLSSIPYGGLPDYYKKLGTDAEFIYSGTFWSGGLPNPGNLEFAAAYQEEFHHPPALQSAVGYAGCQLLMEAARRTGSLDSDKLRGTLLSLKTKTIIGDFATDGRGFQTGHKAVTTQWQDGKQVVVWPAALASEEPRFPTPPWSQRPATK